MDTDLLVDAHNITVYAGERRILDGVDLSLRRGEIVTLVGLKSTPSRMRRSPA